MIYEEITTRKIKYSIEDIMEWVKMFSAKQLQTGEITDESIETSFKLPEDFHITVTYTRNNTNIKNEETPN